MAECEGSQRTSATARPRGALSPAERSRVGVRRTCRDILGTVVGRNYWEKQRELQWLRQHLGLSRTLRRRQLRGKSVRSLRHARQCLAMDGGLLAPKLSRRAERRRRLDLERLHQARDTRRLVGQRAGIHSFGRAQRKHARRGRVRLFQSRRLSRRTKSSLNLSQRVPWIQV